MSVMIQCKFINIFKIFTEELMAKVRKHQFVAKGDKVLWLKNSPRTAEKWFYNGTSVTRGTDHPHPPRHTRTHTHIIPSEFHYNFLGLVTLIDSPCRRLSSSYLVF